MKIMEKINLKDKICCVVDCGLFVELAITLSKSYKKTYYFTPWVINGFPTRNPELPGYGFKEIESIDYLFEYSDDVNKYSFDRVDIFIFPELYFSDIQVHLSKLGKRVWGSRTGERLELDRMFGKRTLKKYNLPVNETTRIVGIDNLKSYLKTHNNKYVKVSHWRGLVESFKHDTYNLTEPLLVKLEHDLGAIKNQTEFIVESLIDAIIESGIDTPIIDGQIPEKVLSGIEIKSLLYAAKVFNFKDLPKQLTSTTTNLVPYFKETQYRNFYSNEIRIDKFKIPYLIDFTCRAGAPPLSLFLNMIDNLAELIWFGADGILIEPNYIAKYGVIIQGYSDFATKNVIPIYFPESLRNNIKLRYGCYTDGTYKIIPQSSEENEIIDVVAIGDSFEEVFDSVKKIAQQIKAYQFEIKTDAINDVMIEIEKSKKIGINF